MNFSDYDFSCYVIKYGRKSIKDLIYHENSIKNDNNTIVPLIWDHRHYKPESVLGHAILEKRDDGIFVYGYLANNDSGKSARQLILGGDVMLSPYLNRVKYSRGYIINGMIREVSLVIERLDPDECYRPVLAAKNKEELKQWQ